MKIACENPRFIQNPRLKYHPDEIVAVYLNGSLVDYHKFYLTNLRFLKNKALWAKNMVKEGRLTSDNIDQFYVVLDSGAIEPIYMMVPCGHCELCKDRKINEWKLRAAAETCCWDNNPYFLTLTYNDKHLPSDGLVKDDIVKFFKRFRTNLARTLQVDYSEVHIRYIYCGEYGHNNHRAHYHALIWNLPTCLHASAIHALVKLSWSGLRGLKARAEFKKNFVWYQGDQEEYKDELIFQHCTNDVLDQYGFVYTKKADAGCAGYICKYMRKDCFVPEGKNEPFFGCSRRGGGIGSPYLDRIREEYLNDPEMNDLSVEDPFTGKICNGAMPQYFKNKLTPSLQLGIGYDNYHKFERFNVVAFGLSHEYPQYDGSYFARFLQFCDTHPVYSEFVKMFRETPDEYYEHKWDEAMPYEIGDGVLEANRVKEFEQLLQYFEDDLIVDYKLLSRQMLSRVLHSMACQEYAESHQMSETEIKEKAYKLRDKARRAHDREVL